MINITDNADIHLSSVVAENKAAAIRLAVNSGGCSGYTYDWQLVSKKEFDDVTDDFIIDLDTGKLVIDNLSSIYIAGTTVDYKKDIFGHKLMVDNPNVESMCGCGESFHV
jgi:iron-sulfur cluster assembly accessory protein